MDAEFLECNGGAQAADREPSCPQCLPERAGCVARVGDGGVGPHGDRPLATQPLEEVAALKPASWTLSRRVSLRPARSHQTIQGGSGITR